MTNLFHLHHHEGIFVLAAIGHLDHLTSKKIVAVKFVGDGYGIRQVDVSQSELHVMIFEIHRRSRLRIPLAIYLRIRSATCVPGRCFGIDVGAV